VLASGAFLLTLLAYVSFREWHALASWIDGGWRDAAYGVAGALGTLTLAFSYDALLEWWGYEPLVNLPLSSSWLLVTLGAVVAPLAEELYFRGRLFDAARRSLGLPRAVFVTTAVFALGHGLPVLLPITFTIGLLFVGLRLLTGRLVAPIVAHAIHNAVAILIFT
jgi:membrane protease YdiL (CAAX protease family)